ncbi:Ankyrin-2 [Thelohanellus kitauei]|uniref:Ankyrin-2 n=1 Tax=Thelohanellus kitauei TaxID=669202 RepID=A0A0C2MIM9_THEKT|nr:Ankyrin-2 [Thelohanellus kitauei]
MEIFEFIIEKHPKLLEISEVTLDNKRNEGIIPFILPLFVIVESCLCNCYRSQKIHFSKFCLTSFSTLNGKLIPLLFLGLITRHTDPEIALILTQKYQKNPICSDVYFKFNQIGHYPLHIIAAISRIDLTKLLFDKLMPTTGLDKDGNSPLHIAVYNHNEDFIHYAVKYFDVNAVDQKMQTPLMLAVESNHVDVVMYFLSLDCDVDSVDIDCRDSLTVAKANGFNDLIYLLENEKAKYF